MATLVTVRVIHGDMREELAKLAAEGVRVQAIVTDPPYHLTNRTPDVKWCSACHRVLGGRDGKPATCPACGGRLENQRSQGQRGFMGKVWDGGDIAFQPETWRLCYDLLPPGGHMVAFSGTRTYHRMVCAIEDAGFEIRDTIGWLYGSGFPKSHDVAKGIDKAAGAERVKIRVSAEEVRNRKATGAGRDGMVGATRPWIERALARGFHEKDGDEPATDAARQWQGWGTALKPAMELICLARKPLSGTVAQTVLAHGTGAINVDGCRVEIGDGERDEIDNRSGAGFGTGDTVGGHQGRAAGLFKSHNAGRWPANVCHDGSDEVLRAFPDTSSGTGAVKRATANGHQANAYGKESRPAGTPMIAHGDSGSAARFFYTAKADASDRLQSKHPTVKPVDLMRWLVRLVCPPGGTILDPFAGSGTTGMACLAEGFGCILVEREEEYYRDILRRIDHVHGNDTPLFTGAAK